MLDRLNCGKKQHFLLQIIDLQVKLLWKVTLNIFKHKWYITVLLDSHSKFNAWCRNWWEGDAHSNVGKALDILNSTAGYTQLIDKQTHFFSGGSSCIDLIFCNKPEIVSKCRIDHSLYQTSHHNLLIAKISANMPPSASYSREVRTIKMAILKDYINPYLFLIEKKSYQLIRKLVLLTALC